MLRGQKIVANCQVMNLLKALNLTSLQKMNLYMHTLIVAGERGWR